MPDRVRHQRFALSRDAYESHVALIDFGLLRGVANVSRYKAGRSADARQAGQVEPLHFILMDEGLDECAFCKVPRALVRSLRLGGWKLRDRESWDAKVSLSEPVRSSHTQFCGAKARWIVN